MITNVPFFHGYLLMLLSVGLIWFRSGVGKIIGGRFADSLAPTLTKFASENPYAWYKNYLETFAIPNAKVIAPFVMWLEFAVGAAIAFSVVFLLFHSKGNKTAELVLLAGLIGGMLLSLNFWLAAGWTGPSTETVNLLMFVIQLIGAFYTLKVLTA